MSGHRTSAWIRGRARRSAARRWPALTCAAILLAAAGAAWGQVGQAYVNITDVEVTELTNAILVTVKADGSFDWYSDWAAWVEEGLLASERGVYSIGGTGHRFGWWVPNARSKLASSYVQIAKYPVSHVEVALGAPEGQTRFKGEFALRFTFETYADMRLFYSRAGEGFVDYWSSEDGRSANIMFISDRQLRTRIEPKVESKFEKEVATELDVRAEGGLLDMTALNAGLADLARELSKATSERIAVGRETDRRVTLSLRGQSLEGVLGCLERGYGLSLGRTMEGYVLAEGAVSTQPAYVQGESVVRPMHYLKAREARELLPNFLFPYLRADDRRNVLSITGPKPLVEHTLKQLEVIDQAGPNIQVEATVVEFTSQADVERALGVSWWGPGFQVNVDSSGGDIGVVNLGGLPHQFAARLRALKTQGAVRLCDRARVVVASGEDAELFVGQDRYIVIETPAYSWQPLQAYVQDVKIGAKLQVEALAGGGDDIRLTVQPEVSTLSEVDPQTRLPVVATRRARATMRVQDGDTVAVGGLRLEQQYATRRKIPLLGDLPLIGGLFRSRQESRRESELVIFLTATKVTGAAREAATGSEGRTDDREKLDANEGNAEGVRGGPGDGARSADRRRGGAVLQHHRGDARGAVQRGAGDRESGRRP